jgi:hypothetical protein
MECKVKFVERQVSRKTFLDYIMIWEEVLPKVKIHLKKCFMLLKIFSLKQRSMGCG